MEGVKKNWVYLIIIGVIIIFFKSIKLWLDRIFGNTNAELIENTKHQLSSKNYFDPNLWANYFSDETFNYNEYKNIANNIENSIGWFYDNEDAIYGALQSVQTGCGVSYLAYVFYKEYRQSLLGKLQSNLTDNEMINVANIVNKKPLK